LKQVLVQFSKVEHDAHQSAYNAWNHEWVDVCIAAQWAASFITFVHHMFKIRWYFNEQVENSIPLVVVYQAKTTI
jgi:hypothetical protein